VTARKSIGYIRQSRRADLDKALSYDGQLAAIRRMSGVESIPVLSDMGKSGRKGGEHLRPGYQELVRLVMAREVDTVYVISLSRLSRSVPELHAFMSLCQSAGCAIESAKEGRLDPSTATGKLTFNIFATLAEYIRDLQVESALENAILHRERGDRMGRVPYGERDGDDPAAVVAAWEATHSLRGSARLLNAEGVPSWSGALWTLGSVRSVLARIAPGTVPSLPKRGVKPASPHRLFRLLRCSCGTVMTPSRNRHGNPYYRCSRAEVDPNHTRRYRVLESALMPWVKEQAARFDPGYDAFQMAADDARRDDLLRRRHGIGEALEVGAYSGDEARQKLAAIDAELAALDVAEGVIDIPDVTAVDWDDAPAANRFLRAIWDGIDLDANLRPMGARWRVREANVRAA
jgi:DNA invertase Pin-like site-specific DNA recombinase